MSQQDALIAGGLAIGIAIAGTAWFLYRKVPTPTRHKRTYDLSYHNGSARMRRRK